MRKKDSRSLDARALEVAQKVNNALNSQKGNSETQRDARLMKVISALLKFKSSESVEKWLLKPNRQFGNVSPVDLVNSEYATRELMKVILSYKGGNYA